MAKILGKTKAESYAITTSKNEKNYNAALLDLLIIVAFTVINIVLAFINADTYFLLSAYIPYALVSVGMYTTGRFPAKYYEDDIVYDFADTSFLVKMVIAAAVILAIYLVCWYFAHKKKVGGLIAATVLFTIDTVFMFAVTGITADRLFDLILHVLIEATLIYGIVCFKKMKKERLEAEEAAMYEAAYASSPDDAYQENGFGFTSSPSSPEEVSVDTVNDADTAETDNTEIE